MTRGKAKNLLIALPSTSLVACVACQRVRHGGARSYRPIAAEPWTTQRTSDSQHSRARDSHCGGSRFEAADCCDSCRSPEGLAVRFGAKSLGQAELVRNVRAKGSGKSWGSLVWGRREHGQTRKERMMMPRPCDSSHASRPSSENTINICMTVSSSMCW